MNFRVGNPMWGREKREMMESLTPRLYRGQYIETIFNARDNKYRESGWELKNGMWSPYFVNLRLIGNSPRLVADVGYSLGLLLENEMPVVNKIMGVEMAGIPLATATSMATLERRGKEIPFCYTRPLPRKVRKPEEARELLDEMRESGILKKYGEKNLVEGILEKGDNIAVWDDMVTDAGSKLIARMCLLYEVERLGVEDVECYHASFLLDREQGATEAGLSYDTSEIDPRPQKIHMHSIIPFRDGILTLEGDMQADEFGLVRDYMEEPGKYQDPEAIEYVMRERKSLSA